MILSPRNKLFVDYLLPLFVSYQSPVVNMVINTILVLKNTAARVALVSEDLPVFAVCCKPPTAVHVHCCLQLGHVLFTLLRLIRL